MTNRIAWILAGALLLATVIHAFATRYEQSAGIRIDRWTGEMKQVVIPVSL